MNKNTYLYVLIFWCASRPIPLGGSIRVPACARARAMDRFFFGVLRFPKFPLAIAILFASFLLAVPNVNKLVLSILLLVVSVLYLVWTMLSLAGMIFFFYDTTSLFAVFSDEAPLSVAQPRRERYRVKPTLFRLVDHFLSLIMAATYAAFLIHQLDPAQYTDFTLKPPDTTASVPSVLGALWESFYMNQILITHGFTQFPATGFWSQLLASTVTITDWVSEFFVVGVILDAITAPATARQKSSKRSTIGKNGRKRTRRTGRNGGTALPRQPRFV